MIQQLEGFVDGEVGAIARLRHDRWLDRFEQVAAGGHVIGQWHQGVGATGVDDNCRLRIAATLQQVVEFAPCLFEAVGLAVGREHLRGQLKHHHQRVGRFLRGLFNAFPAWSEQGKQRQQPGQAEGNPRQFAVAAITAAEQDAMKGFGQDHLPAPGAFLPMPEFP